MKRQELIEKWLEALESGEYKQAQSRMRKEMSKGHYSYCCLGVACEVANKLRVKQLDLSLSDDWNEMLPAEMSKTLGIAVDGNFIVEIYHRGTPYTSLTDLNDNGIKFKTIAKIIREQLEKKNFAKK